MMLHKVIACLVNKLDWAGRRWKLVLLLAAALLALTGEGPPPASIEAQVTRRLAGEQFDFASWETRALLDKLAHDLVAPQRYMGEADRHDFFVDYLQRISSIQRLNWDIERVYTDPEVSDPEAETAPLRAQLAALRGEQQARQPVAEAILEEQTAYVLSEAGFGLLEREFPPVGAHFTPLPLLLVISPRDHIENAFRLSLRHGLGVAQRETIEDQIDADLDVSSLVTGIGGMAAYPAMLLEHGSPNWIAEVTAHEWTHHYLTLRPLGWNYDASGEARTINETVATIVGTEVGGQMIARYYPEYVPPEPEPEPEKDEQEGPLPPEPPAFDFRAEMRETRISVDELLAENKIEEAETYMEERRKVFVANGYAIRKLNQAYFAFHGSYAAEPGAAGEDPVGPAVQELRARSPDLHTFVARVAHVTSLQELELLIAETESGYSLRR